MLQALDFNYVAFRCYNCGTGTGFGEVAYDVNVREFAVEMFVF